MKKTISILLSLLMVMSVLTCAGVPSFAVDAEGNVALDEKVDAVIETAGEEKEFYFTPEVSGNYLIINGLNSMTDIFTPVGDSLLEEETKTNVFQYFSLEAGVKYRIILKRDERLNDKGSVSFTLSKNPLADLDYYPICGSFTAYEGSDEKPISAGDTLIFYFENGTTETYKFNGYNFEDENSNTYGYDDYGYGVGYYDGYGIYHGPAYGAVTVTTSLGEDETWTLGEAGTVTVKVGTVSKTYPVTVTEDNVAEIRAESTRPLQFIENMGRQNNGDDYFYPFYGLFDDIVITIVYTDGTEEAVRWTGHAFCSDKGRDDIDLGIETNQNESPWKKGADNRITFEYHGKTAYIPVEIIDNPIKSFTYIPVSNKVYTGFNSYEETDSAGNKYTQYQFYERAGDKLILNFKDGTSKTYTYFYDDMSLILIGFFDSDLNPIPYGLYFNIDDNQEETHWYAGKNNIAKVSLAGLESTVNIEVVNNPVKSVELSLSKNVISEDDYRTVYQVGNKLKVTYADNSVQNFTMRIFSDKAEPGLYFADADGKKADPWVNLYDESDENGAYVQASFRGVKSNKVYVSYDKKQVASIKYTPADRIELTAEKIGTKLGNGDFIYDSGAFYYKLLANDSVLEVTYTDGTTSKFTVFINPGKLYEGSGYNNYTYWMTDQDGQIIDYNNFNYEEAQSQFFHPWTKDSENYIKVTYRGASCLVPVFIVDKAYDYFGFPDVKPGSWFYDAVKYCAKHKFINGYGNGTFGPSNALQRQDFVVILANIAGADLSGYTSCKLKDVDINAYYGKAVAWAVDKGIIAGYQNGKFGVGDPINREQVATILYRYMKSPAVSDVDSKLAKFPDKGNISEFAKTPLAWAVENNIISGMQDGRVAPKDGAVRAQIASIIMRMDQNGMFNA